MNKRIYKMIPPKYIHVLRYVEVAEWSRKPAESAEQLGKSDV